MRVCLLAHHPHNFAGKRLQEELKGQCEVLRPQDLRWSWPPVNSKTYDVTFNRLSTVESGAFERALGALPCWGRQVNPWELRLALWDKAHQAMWLAKKGVQAVPSFMVRGELTSDDASWCAFKEQHAQQEWVLKFNRGQRGVGVHFLKDENELLAWLETLRRMGDQDFLVQPRLQKGYEGRLVVLDGQPWAWLERSGQERANFAQGGSAKEVPWTQAPAAVKEIAEKLSMPHTVLAVDLWVGDSIHVMDVNTVPGVEQLEAVTGRNFTKELVLRSIRGIT
jgi:glutathione synthase/RimK-type ligase-like ATP-grasp enzyme